jgi:hypothetical protein
MARTSVFISYRRDDAAGYARAIAEQLTQAFGADRIFMDVEDIVAGHAFDDVITRAVGEAQVLLVLIGKRWRGERDGMAARIDDPTDLVRREVAIALAQGVQVIPVLLDGAAMPSPAVLPEALRPLATRQAIELQNSRFREDIDRLVKVLREALGEPAAAASGLSRRRLGGALLAAALAVAAGVALWRGRRRAPDSAAEPAAARPPVNGEWQAEVRYDWSDARHRERFVFGGDGASLHGSASFLGVARGIVAGAVEPGGLSFSTRSIELAGSVSSDTLHRYRGRLEGDAIHFVMQTEGGATPHSPVEFVARRTPR